MTKLRKLIFIAAAAANAVSVVGAVIFSVAGSSMADSQSYNKAAARWSTEGARTSVVPCGFQDTVR